MERTRKTIAECRCCGELLHDGDTAYKLSDAYYCPECVSESLVICRPTNYYEYPHNHESIREDD